MIPRRIPRHAGDSITKGGAVARRRAVLNNLNNFGTERRAERWAAVGAAATVLGACLTGLQLLAPRPSLPLLAGLAVLLVVATAVFVVLAMLREQCPRVVFLAIRDKDEQQQYYERLTRCLREARGEIYYSGRVSPV